MNNPVYRDWEPVQHMMHDYRGLTASWSAVLSTYSSIAERYHCPAAKFLVLGDKVDYGIWLSYRPASLCSRAGRYHPMPYSTVSPQSGSKNLVLKLWTVPT